MNATLATRLIRIGRRSGLGRLAGSMLGRLSDSFSEGPRRNVASWKERPIGAGIVVDAVLLGQPALAQARPHNAGDKHSTKIRKQWEVTWIGR